MLEPPNTLLLLGLPLSLLAGCPADEEPNEPIAGSSSTTDEPNDPPPADTLDATDTDPPPPDTDTDPLPPDTDTDPLPPDTDTDTDSGGGPVLPGCECIPDDAGSDVEPVSPSAPTCGEPVCGPVDGSCWGGYCGDAPFELDDPTTLECALVALRDRTPGILRWNMVENGGQFDRGGYLLVHADGTAVRRTSGWNDLSYDVGDAVLGPLPAPEHFDACLADPDDRARFDCMNAVLESTLAVCDAGWSYSKG